MHISALLVPLLSAGLALGIALYVCPIIIRAALKYGIVDAPEGDLKNHRAPVPYLGGLVVFASFLVALATSFTFDARVLAILLGASLIVSVGLVDDLGTLTPKDKFIGQLIAALVLVKAGVVINIAAWPFPLAEIITLLWLVTCMNAFNILDVSDGLAGTAAAVAAAGLTVIAWLNAEPMIATLSATVVGSCIGFLWFNREPARIYLGDTGSMLLGTLLGALAITARYSEANEVSAFFAPALLLAVPLFDLVLVILARLASRRPIYYGSPDHFAVRMRDAGVRSRSIARGAGLFGAVATVVAIASTWLANTGALMLATGAVAGGLLTLVWVLWRFPARTSPRFVAPTPVPRASPPTAGISAASTES